VAGVAGISRDVTDITRAEEEKLKLQEQLQQSQKMEAVGRLAGGIAHDFNNILTVITGYCEMAIEESGENAALLGSLEEIKRASRRSATLISQLLTFSRRQVLLPRVFDLAGLVQGMEGMLLRLLGEDVRLLASRVGESLLVNADPGRMEQVIMNLAVNSRDAMPGGGDLIIRTQAELLQAEDLSGHPEVTPGEFVSLTVSDTGLGMDEVTQERIFEPFFTTKDVGKGTGLGLATVYGIVRQSNGHVTCRSVIGRGTTFTVYLPRVTQPAQGTDAAEDGHGLLPKGTERILLAEDDESVRRFVSTILETAGYTVLTADSGASALDLLARIPEPPQLLLTDVIMPGMDGRVLAQEVTRKYPEVGVLFMSGYAEVAAGLPGFHAEDPRLIQKPFSAADLLRKIRSMLPQIPARGS
jgi:nitrogen-specific signal transduction histidine kinase/ActR/RegA family two-component response regulator